MKDEIRTSLVQFSPQPMRDKGENCDFIEEKINELSSENQELIVFPEMSLTNFFEHGDGGRLAYWKYGAITLEDPLIDRIVSLSKKKGVYVVFGFAERSNIVGVIYNSAMLTGPGGPIGITRKIHLPGFEKLYFSSGNEIPVFTTALGKIGLSICYDSWFPEYVRVLAIKGAEIIITPASIWMGGSKGGIGREILKREFWDSVPLVKAVENQAFILACNGGGTHWMGDELGTWERMGMSKIVSPFGELLASTPENDESVLSAVLKHEDLEASRSVYTFLADRAPAAYAELSKV